MGLEDLNHNFLTGPIEEEAGRITLSDW